MWKLLWGENVAGITMVTVVLFPTWSSPSRVKNDEMHHDEKFLLFCIYRQALSDIPYFTFPSSGIAPGYCGFLCFPLSRDSTDGKSIMTCEVHSDD